jgi:hypothetical protein
VVLYQRTQFEISISKDTVDVIGTSGARIRSAALLAKEPGSFWVGSFKKYLLQLASKDQSSSLSTDASESSESLWANFPVKESLWRKMKSFRLDIDIPGLRRQATSATEISENFILSFDMVHRVTEYLETIRQHIKNLEIFVRISRIRAYPVAVISRVLNAILQSFSNLWSVKRLKICLAITSVRDLSFDVLEGPLHEVEEIFPGDASTLQDTLKELRIKIARYKHQTLLSSDRNIPEKPMMRSALYHLEAVLQVLYHPLIFSFIQQEANQLKEAHTLAVIAEHKRDLNKFRDSYSRISHALDLYTRTQGNIARAISRRVQSKLHELNSTDNDPAELA